MRGTEQTVPFLQLGGRLLLPERNSPFFAKRHFFVGAESSRGPRVGNVGEDFRHSFLRGQGKIEPVSGAKEVCWFGSNNYHVRSAFCVVAQFGGSEVAKTDLADLYELLSVQGHDMGELTMLTRQRALNVFFVPDMDDEMQVVIASRLSGAWSISMRGLDYGVSSTDGVRFFIPSHLPCR